MVSRFVLAKISDQALDNIRWNENGLIPAIAQDIGTRQVLMLAWMNREALRQTFQSGEATYWSRSRGKLWRKGESSGHIQKVHAIHLDCDNDAILLEVEQIGGIACHTGRYSCFFQKTNVSGHWTAVEPVLKNAGEIYGK
jgi:phosphoribosyl-AMP cyclohydrolase